MKLSIFILCWVSVSLGIWLNPSTGSAQYSRDQFGQWSLEQRRKAATADSLENLSQLEKDLFYYTNLARINGRLFADTYLKEYVRQEGLKWEDSYVRSLVKTLKDLPVLPVLKPHPALMKAAAEHAADMGKAGKTGHQSTKGVNFDARIRAALKNPQATVAENCSYGVTGALQLIVDLLIDDGIPSLGHRKNLLSPAYSHMGVAVAPHSRYRTNFVQEFAGNLK